VRSQLCQLFRQQLIDGLFDFREAHYGILAAESENKVTRKLEEEQRVLVLRFAPIFGLAKP